MYFSDDMNAENGVDITVTITIKEYRELVQSAAKSDYELSKARNEAAELREKVRRLESTIAGMAGEDGR